jgi:hypothetical protein
MADGTRQATVPQLESSGNQPGSGLHTLKVFRTAQTKRNRADPRNRTKATGISALQPGEPGCLQFNLGIEKFLTGENFPCQFAQFFYQLRCFETPLFFL